MTQLPKVGQLGMQASGSAPNGMVPAQFRVVVVRRLKYACRSREKVMVQPR